MADAAHFNRSARTKTASERDASVEDLLAFEHLLADLSVRFANVPAEQVECEIQLAQTRLRRFLWFDRCTFGEFEEDGSLVVLFSSAAEGIGSTATGPIPSQLEWFLAKLRAGETIVIQSATDDLPPEAAAEAAYCRRSGLVSHIAIPLLIEGRVVGAIAFAAFRATHEWPDYLIARLKLVGEVFAQAIARKREREKLMIAMAEIKVLKARLQRENAEFRDTARGVRPRAFTSRSPSFLSAIEQVMQVAKTSSTVLLLGETGSGKQVLAQAVHDHVIDKRSLRIEQC